jgi:predicted small metal-binding protein
MEGVSEEEVLNKAQQHAYEFHAIKPEEMTSELKVKIQENIRDA